MDAQRSCSVLFPNLPLLFIPFPQSANSVKVLHAEHHHLLQARKKKKICGQNTQILASSATDYMEGKPFHRWVLAGIKQDNTSARTGTCWLQLTLRGVVILSALAV